MKKKKKSMPFGSHKGVQWNDQDSDSYPSLIL